MSKVENALIMDNSDLEIKTIVYDPKGNPNSQNALNLAKLQDLEVKFPANNELFIDIDNEHSFQLFQKQLDIIRKYIGVVDDQSTISRHGLPGRHITLTLDRTVTELERIALQACLGSDRVRELLGFIQNDIEDPHPTLFLEKKPLLLAVPRDEEIPY